MIYLERLLFVGPGKAAESILTLKTDHHIQPTPFKTTVYSPTVNLLDTYEQFGIDVENFELVLDHQVPNYDRIKHLDPWLRQQFIKLLAVDSTATAYNIIQDADMMLTAPYRPFNIGYPNPFILENQTPEPEYSELAELFTGIPRQTAHSFVNDLMPLMKGDWLFMRKQIEERSQRPWLDTLLDEINRRVEQKGYANFSEYEMIGNWLAKNYKLMPTTVQVGEHITNEVARAIKKQELDIAPWQNNFHNVIPIKIYDEDARLDFEDIEYVLDSFRLT